MSLTTWQIVLDNYNKAESHFYFELTLKNVIIKQLCVCLHKQGCKPCDQAQTVYL